ncbi:MAG: hypothetical protein ACI841_004442 [Planctomycetota bacterium]|jgi:hypothetical protein
MGSPCYLASCQLPRQLRRELCVLASQQHDAAGPKYGSDFFDELLEPE